MKISVRQQAVGSSFPLPSLWVLLGFMETRVQRQIQAAFLVPSASTHVPLELYEACEQAPSILRPSRSIP